MLDKKWLIQNPLLFEESCKKRNIKCNFHEFEKLNENAKKIITLQEEKRAAQKKIKTLNDEAINLKQELIKLDEEREKAESDLKTWLINQPNILLPQVPYGKDENDNQVIFETPKSDKITKPHFDVIDNLIMKDEAVNLSGSRFLVMKNALAKLSSALVSFMKEENEKLGYEEYIIPSLVNEACLFGTGQLPKFADDAFFVNSDQWLISTGEISLVNMFRDYVFKESDLPKLCMTFSSCFRKEAGSSGRDTKGLIRLHQFNKVELVSITTPSQAEKIHQKQLNAAKNILNKLEIPYRVMLLCGADSGFTASLQYDVEMWMPGMQRYLEIASCSQCDKFQARRANIKYKNAENKLEYAHTLNGSALPLERLIAGIIENYLEDDLIKIPTVLQEKIQASYINLNGDLVNKK